LTTGAELNLEKKVIQKALYDILNDVDEVNRIFIIIKAQKEY